VISIGFDDQVKIGLRYILDSLHTSSPFGAERVRKLRFYAPDEREALAEELRCTERAANAVGALRPLYEKIMLVLCQLKDVRGSLKRLSEGAVLDHVELFELKGFLLRVADLIPLFDRMNETVLAEGIAFTDPSAALGVLDPEGTRSRGFYIPDGATERLRAIRAEKKRLEARLYDAPDTEKDAIRTERTRICAEEETEERAIRGTMCTRLLPHVPEMLSDADAAGRLDLLIQKALFAAAYGGVRPEITDGALELIDMANPELADLLKAKGRAFVPVSIAIDRGATVITGANMGGKSVAMKTLALNVLLFHAGFLVCAKAARLPMFESVRMLFDDAQSMQSGLSGFGSEIVRFNDALSEVEKGFSLFLLDELARGTNPDEGAVIVQAVTQYLNGLNAISILATHYDGVTEHARFHYQIIGLRDIDPDAIGTELSVSPEDGVAIIARHMNYGLYRVEGKADCPRDALHIARMLSLKPEILSRIEQAYKK
jgi:dsDNA-specific endonuclease/ATPase MutS2